MRRLAYRYRQSLYDNSIEILLIFGMNHISRMNIGTSINFVLRVLTFPTKNSLNGTINDKLMLYTCWKKWEPSILQWIGDVVEVEVVAERRVHVPYLETLGRHGGAGRVVEEEDSCRVVDRLCRVHAGCSAGPASLSKALHDRVVHLNLHDKCSWNCVIQ